METNQLVEKPKKVKIGVTFLYSSQAKKWFHEKKKESMAKLFE